MPHVAEPTSVRIHSPAPRARPGRAAVSVRLDSIQDRLYAVVQKIGDRQDALAEFVMVAGVMTNAQSAAHFEVDAAGKLTAGPRFNAQDTAHKTVLTNAHAKIGDAARRGRPALLRLDDGPTVVAVPVTVPGPPQEQPAAAVPREVLAVVLMLGDAEVEPFVVSLQMIAAYLTQWYERRASRRLDWEADASAAIVELVGAIENSGEPKAACFTVAGKLKQTLGCDKVIVGLRQTSGRVSVRSISNVARFDRRGEAVRLYEAALNEAVVRDSVTVWPAEADQRHATLAHRKLAESARVPFVVSTPLKTLDGDLIGAVTIVGGDSGRSRNETAHLLQAAGAYLGNALQTVKRARGGPLTRLGRSLFKNRGWRLKMLVAVAFVVAGVLAVPLPHKVACDCRLEPLTRRFAVAPYEGILRQSLVRPGDLVTEGQPLARMDDREIQWELSGLIADRDRAAKQRDTSMSQRDIPAAQMAQLEVERLKLKIRLLEHRRDNLEIHGAIDGVVLDGDLDDAAGAPVEMGQPLFEIAPLDQLRLEVEVPEEDLPYVRAGLPVTVTLDGRPNETINGQIVRIRPQAELREEQNVFVAEVLVENSERQLRPGMRGRAKVVGQNRVLGWLLFHRTWERAVSALR